jgi:hypothetical protein
VDDRALNGHVWQALANRLPKSPLDKPLRVMEVGAGIGTMIERMLSRKLLNYAVYTAIDTQEQNKDLACKRLREWSSNHNLRFEEASSDQWRLAGKRKYIVINFRDEDIFDFATHEHERYDLMIANAFLDLVDIPTTLPLLLNLLDKGGLIYFTINYDGVTILEPVIDSEFDKQILDLYHCAMNNCIVNGKRSGDSKSGRHLVSYLKNAGVQILAAGASDWVVIAGLDGYSQDEACFMHHIVHTIHQALITHPELDLNKFEDWIAERHHQIERGDLIYIAHQLDFLGAIVD